MVHLSDVGKGGPWGHLDLQQGDLALRAGSLGPDTRGEMRGLCAMTRETSPSGGSMADALQSHPLSQAGTKLK